VGRRGKNSISRWKKSSAARGSAGRVPELLAEKRGGVVQPQSASLGKKKTPNLEGGESIATTAQIQNVKVPWKKKNLCRGWDGCGETYKGRPVEAKKRKKRKEKRELIL